MTTALRAALRKVMAAPATSTTLAAGALFSVAAFEQNRTAVGRRGRRGRRSRRSKRPRMHCR